MIISLKINLFSPWYSWKIAELALNNNHSLIYSIWAVKLHWLDNFLLTVTDKDLVLLVPDSCKKGQQYKRRPHNEKRRERRLFLHIWTIWQLWKTIKTTLVSILLRQFVSCFGFLDISGDTHQYMYIVWKYQIYLHSLQKRTEELAKGARLCCLFLQLVQLNYIFSDNVRILSMYILVI